MRSTLDPVALLGGPTRALPGVTLPSGEQVYHLPQWGRAGDIGRVGILRKLVNGYGRDPRLRAVAAQIVAQVPARDYRGQAAAIQRFLQQRIRYLNEPGELLQAPLYTLRCGHGDCDDMAMLGAALLWSIRLPCRFVLSGKSRSGRVVRWVEGQRPPRGVKWSHIYLCVRLHPFDPRAPWCSLEPTLQVPLGWDVAQQAARAGGAALPELAGAAADEADSGSSLVSDGAEFVSSLPWREIVAATLPLVFSTILITQYQKRQR